MEDSSGVAVLVPHSRGQRDTVFIPDRCLHGAEDQQRQQQKQAADSLIQVIEKLSKIVEKRPKRCTVSGKKRPLMTCASVPVPDSRDSTEGLTPCKRSREQRDDCPISSSTPGHIFESEPSSLGTRTVTCYQCSMCRFVSPKLELLKEHLLLHDEQHSDLILMCSECQFTSNHQEELVAHVRLHLEEGDHARHILYEQGIASARSAHQKMAVLKVSNMESDKTSTPKKWYSFEQGRYRCLICNYECIQQRNLKTHAWKHAGLVYCSYPIFEDETDCPDTLQSTRSHLVPAGREDTIVVLAAVGGKPQTIHGSSSLQLELCASPEVRCQGEKEGLKTVETKLPVISQVFSLKDPEKHLVEVQVTPEAQMELELETESQQASSDSLLSSAQKIINCSGNSAGHVNVIVERLPCAEEPVSSKPLLLSPEVRGDKTLLSSEEPDLESQHLPVCYKQKEEVVIAWNGEDRQQEEESVSLGSSSDENMPPVRRRTYSESLRLHSLAAEALVAMPMRTPELSKTAAKDIHDLSTQSPDTGQRIIEIADTTNLKVSSGELAAAVGDAGALLNIGFQSSKDSRDVLVEGPSKAGISMSLLTVIERLQERSDQNTSDEDILKELQDNAQSQHAGGVPGGAAVPSDISTTDGLVEYIAGSERPYRCRLCLYSSGNKGYIKQHLRVHRQRQPYQCPICEHIACDSKDLERHMIHHFKPRMYNCKQCTERFHYKSQLRNHERDGHGIDDMSSTLTHVAESTTIIEESAKITDEDSVGEQSVFKCDVCDYTSSTYVGVRNHRRIHNSDKPYRCCSCDFATTNMNSLKSHMKRHPQEHQAMQLLEQYRCSLCGYVCSHPPSLKSHMWKHAGDQNYNYEQVNKAINEAISQSSRSPATPLKSTHETGVEHPYVVLSRKGKQSPEVDSAIGGPEGNSVRSSSSREQAGGAVAWRSGSGQTRPGMEYCVLLFCCCICGFESTSKEQLMEHMKQHEGDLISIILSKEQQGNQPTETSSSQ
ncbi:zinc finger protein 507-like [Sinocyclocheilus rhinocerous]|uniref:Zinc finger protein 507-like n=1 Tax=Sinocyclocheilus rhinocerous TaxID=307959 RepID=A0A673H382_9TELE|nr:PREDICTED: zinc finger protein 507-like [Sinocyclocheilus rhinocerous]